MEYKKIIHDEKYHKINGQYLFDYKLHIQKFYSPTTKLIDIRNDLFKSLETFFFIFDLAKEKISYDEEQEWTLIDLLEQQHHDSKSSKDRKQKNSSNSPNSTYHNKENNNIKSIISLNSMKRQSKYTHHNL